LSVRRERLARAACRTALLAAALAASACACWREAGPAAEPGTPTTGAPPADVDAFGTRNLYPSAASGREWHAAWSANPRVLRDGDVDPYDPQFSMRGSNHTLDIKGDGTARSSGDVIRMYVGDPTRAARWTNVELTVYGMRVSEQRGAGSAVGFEFQIRTDDGHTSASRLDRAGLPIQCDGKAYGFSFRTDGRALVEKELKHPITTAQVAKNVWDGAPFPRNAWVGMKLIVYTVDGGRHVKQEIWRDLTDGANGGTWEKVLENVDAGGWAIDAAAAASCRIPADYIITEAQPLVILRNDAVTEQWFKKVTIREIQP
jgi:hypothetical protein